MRQAMKPMMQNQAQDPVVSNPIASDLVSSHALLLQAAYLSGTAAISAWEKWRSSVDFENLDWGAYQLLPHLHQNLIKHNIQDPLMPRMQGIQRLFWCKNQGFLPVLATVLLACQQAGIQPILPYEILFTLGDGQLAPRSKGAKLLNALPLMIPIADMPAAVTVLQQLGWQSPALNPIVSLQQSRSLSFERAGQPAIILQTHLHHWHLLPTLVLACADRAVPVQIGEVQSLTWDVTEHLLDLALRCQPDGPDWPILALSDCIWLLQNHAAQIDWPRLQATASQYCLLVPLQSLFARLQDLQMPLPAAAIAITCASTPTIERWEYALSTQTRPRRWGRWICRYAQHHRQVAIAAGHAALWSFPKFLQAHWQLDSVWQVPVYGLWRQLQTR